MEKEGPQKVGLRREVGLFSGVAISMGTMIGSGIFLSPGYILQRTGTVIGSLLLWVACGLVSCLSAFTYIELGTEIPLSGGEYMYIYRSMGEIPAFLTSCFFLLITQPVSLTIMCLTSARYFVAPFSGEHTHYKGWLEALVTMVLLSYHLICYINCRSVTLATTVQNIFMCIKLFALFIVIGGGIYEIAVLEKWEFLTSGFTMIEGTELNISSIALAFYGGMWSYDGWSQINRIIEEFKDPTRNLPLSVFIAVPLVTLIYVSVNVAYLTILTPVEYHQSKAIAVLWAQNIFTFKGFDNVIPIMMGFFVACSAFGAANGTAFTSARLFYASSRVGHLPQIMSYVNIDRLTPSPSVMVTNILSIMWLLVVDVEELLEIFSIVQWAIYGSTFLSCIILRWTEPDLERPFKVWLVLPILLFLLSIYLVITPLVLSPKFEYLYILAMILVSLLLYIPFVKKGISCPKPVIDFLQKMLLAVPPEKMD